MQSSPKTAAEFFPETVRTYSAPLFKADTPAADQLCARLLDTVIKTYPHPHYAYHKLLELELDPQSKRGP